jgi:hypothetical protein
MELPRHGSSLGHARTATVRTGRRRGPVPRPQWVVRAELDVQAAHVRTDVFTDRDSPTLSCPHSGPDLRLLIPIANATHGRADWAFRASVGLGPVLTWTSPCVLAGRWRCPLVQFATSALPTICAGLTLRPFSEATSCHCVAAREAAERGRGMGQVRVTGTACHDQVRQRRLAEPPRDGRSSMVCWLGAVACCLSAPETMARATATAAYRPAYRR